jgi:predicted DNA-binding antitoxin AbrB/MazE fold protein
VRSFFRAILTPINDQEERAMTTITEAIYENGALKLVNNSGFKEHQRYRIIVEEIAASPAVSHDAALAAELDRRTSLLPDGRKVIAFVGLLEHEGSDLSFENIEAILDETRREHEKKLDELYGPEQ